MLLKSLFLGIICVETAFVSSVLSFSNSAKRLAIPFNF